MEKGKLITLVILGLFLTTFFIGIVSAADEPTRPETLTESISEGFKEFISGALPGATYDTVAKLLLISLVAMIVFSIIGFLPFIPAKGEPSRDYIQWGISIVVAILAFLYVPLTEIRALVANYQALGVALTSFLPLLIIVIFTEKLEEYGEGEEIRRRAWISIINKAIWTIFVVYLIFKFFASPVLGWLYLLTIIIVVVWVWKARELIVHEWLTGEKVSAADIASAKVEVARIESDIKQARKDKSEVQASTIMTKEEIKASAKRLDEKIADLRADLRKESKKIYK